MDLLSREDKETIAGRARTLQEHLDRDEADPEAVETPPDVAASVDDYLAEWCDAVAGGDEDLFERRLGFEDLDRAACRRRIADDGWRDDDLPGWVDRLEELLAFVVENPSADVTVDGEYPFVDVLAPVLAFAREAVGDPPEEYVSESAAAGLLGGLAFRVTRLWSRPLFIEFKTHVASDDPDLVFDDDIQPEAGATEYYDEFTAALLDGDLRSFVLEYSFLARLLVTVVDHWIARVDEFYDRVAADWAALGDAFADGSEPGRITDVSTYGDPHQEGREVFGVTFESGRRAAYKPRNAGIVVGFYELLEWVNEHGDLPDLRTLEFVYRDDYAWMEWVDPQECATEAEAVAYYRRAGMLVCLFYALAATDMHLENIIAEGGQPVSVDLETLAEPVASPEMRVINETVKVVAGTVVRTGVVPRHVVSDEVGDMAGFSVQRGEVTMEGQRFTDLNTDRMDLVVEEYPDREGANLPEYDGEVVGPRDNVEEILGGFEEMYRFVVDHREALLAGDGPVEGLTDRESRVRVLYRPTSVYGQIIDSTSEPAALRTGVQFGVRTEALAKLVVRGEVDRAVWSVFEAERDVLRDFNTPRFSAKLHSTDLFDLDDVVVADFFRKRPIDQIRDRFDALGEDDLEEQLAYLRWGYGGYDAAHTRTTETDIDALAGGDDALAGGSDDSSVASTDDDAPATTDDGTVVSTDDGAPGPDAPPGATAGGSADAAFERTAGDAARAVFDRVEANALVEDGAPTWVLRKVGADGGLHVHPVEDRLYDGRVGVGLFAAAAARALGEDRYAEFARETLAPVVRAVEEGTFENDPDSHRYPPRPVGGGVGLGSIVYGLTTAGTLLDDATYHGTASEVAALVDADRVGDDDAYDVLHGSAGAVLGLLALDRATADGGALDRATMAGEHLLANARDHDGALAWHAAHSPRPLCGFSHGVAGIAYALARLADATGETRFHDAALAAVEYENELYDDGARNWPDLRAETDGDWFDGWCHGRTGIGLARLGMVEVATASEATTSEATTSGATTSASSPPPNPRRDVDRALDGLDPTTAYGTDHLCCGNFGRVELLLRAGRTLDDPAARRDAERLAAASVRRAERAGRFAVQWQTDHWYNPALFSGEAGVGYSLLRFVDASLPCLLLWE